MTTISTYLKNPIVHGIVTFIVYIVPLALIQEQAIANLTISSIAAGLIQWLKNNS